MKTVELLMVEHASIRLHLRFIRERKSDSIYELEDFVRNYHSKVEDDLVFPKLRKLLVFEGEQQHVTVLSRLESDHKLIEKIGEQIRAKTVEGDAQTLDKRIVLFADALESHNSNEETLAFPFWQASEAEEIDVGSQARRMIEAYGVERYFRITGISQKLLDSVKRTA